jgi:hypothetical protein
VIGEPGDDGEAMEEPRCSGYSCTGILDERVERTFVFFSFSSRRGWREPGVPKLGDLVGGTFGRSLAVKNHTEENE